MTWEPPERYYEVHLGGATYYIDTASGEQLETRLASMTLKEWGCREDGRAFFDVTCVDGAPMRLLLCEIRCLVETGPEDRERWRTFKEGLAAQRKWSEE
jgi:hypothetical protein